MTTIALTCLFSDLHDQNQLANSHKELLEGLRQEFALTILQPGEKAAADLQAVFIASGGTERKFLEHYRVLPRPLLLLTDGKHNSLAAAMEILSWVSQQNEEGEIIHGDINSVRSRLRQLARFAAVRKIMSGRIGIIGPPSDWLIASTIDQAKAKKHWGSDFIKIKLTEITKYKITNEKETREMAQRFIAGSTGLDGVDEAAVQKAVLLIPALRAIFSRHQLQAATLRCFTLLKEMQTSGCLALSRLNDEGLVCGCEGDVPAVFSMLLLHELSGATPFMANPSFIDRGANEIVLAHCTVATAAVRGYRLQTHFESGIGVGLAGEFVPGPVTIFKIGAPDLGSYFVSAGELLANTPAPGLCRTQVRIKLRENVDYFLRTPLANHHVLINGDHAGAVADFMRYSGCTRIG